MSSSSVTVCGGSSWSEKADPWKTVPASHVGSFDYPMTNPSASLPSALLWAPLPFLFLTLPFPSPPSSPALHHSNTILFIIYPPPPLKYYIISSFYFYSTTFSFCEGGEPKFLPTGALPARLLTLSRVVAINWTCNAASLQLYFVVSGRE